MKSGDTVTCSLRDSDKEINGKIKKFKYDILKRKTYAILDINDDKKKPYEIGVKYCMNQSNNILNKIDRLKHEKYIKKQINKLQKIIQQINNLNVSDQNYDILLRNLNYEYNTIKKQIEDTIELKRKKLKISTVEGPAIAEEVTTNKEYENNYDAELKEVQKKRALLLELLQKTKPKEYYQLAQILNRKGGGHTFGSVQKYNQKAGYII